MDSHAFIELQRLPYRTRLDQQYQNYENELKQGYLMGREGDGPVLPRMLYKDLFGDTYRDVLNFGSNNYLGLSHHPYVRRKVCEAVERYGVGTGGSPAFSGYSRSHRELENRLARLGGHDDAVLLPSGFMANLCWVNGLMKRQDVLLYDKYSHASVINAIKMAGVQFFPYDPENLGEFEELVEKVRARRASNAQLFATVEGVRSIDGSVIELGRWIDVCKRHDIVTILDDAHGLGTLGRSGAGTLEHLGLMGEVDFRMSTCSKGLGAQGAFVSGSRKSIFYLRTYSNAYVFTTALAFPVLAAIGAGLDVLGQEPDLVPRLHANVRTMRGRLEAAGHRVGHSPAGIIPVYLPDGIARAFNRAVFDDGLFAHVMEYPMVAPGMERLRISMGAQHTRDQIVEALAIIDRASQRFGVLKP
jgi:glycine C-acetyltransferase